MIGNRIAEKLKKTASRSTPENPKKNAYKQQRSLRQYTHQQKSKNQLLMNFNYYNYKYKARIRYQKITNLLKKANDQPSKFKTRKWIEMNYISNGTYETGKQIKLSTSILKSRDCDYSYAYILVKETIKVAGAEEDAAARRTDKRNKLVTLINCTQFTHCTIQINNAQDDNAEYLDILMLMYNLIEYSNNYVKTSKSLWQYHKDISNYIIVNSEPFKFKW